MNDRGSLRLGLMIGIAAWAASGAGCSGSGPSLGAEEVAEPVAEHEHGAGPRGGLIVALGGQHLHAEAIVTDDGALRLYILGKDVAHVEEVESQSLTAFVRAVDGHSSHRFQLEPDPQPGDAPGKTSAFEGRLPDVLDGGPSPWSCRGSWSMGVACDSASRPRPTTGRSCPRRSPTTRRRGSI